GPFELNSSVCTLRRSGIALKLPPQPLRVLLLLIERQGEVVTRAEIQRHLWGESTFVDFERGINFSINQIRAVLCDDVATPRYIQTVPRLGYRFIAPVTRDGTIERPWIAPSTVSDSADPVIRLESEGLHGEGTLPSDLVHVDQHRRSERVSEIRGRAKLWPFKLFSSPEGFSVIAGLLLIAALGYLATFWWQNKEKRLPVQIVRVTSSPGFELQPNFSPDGNQIVFSAADSGNYEIYVKAIGDEKMLRLTQPPGSSFCPKWSPDGKTIAFERRTQTSGGAEDRSF